MAFTSSSKIYILVWDSTSGYSLCKCQNLQVCFTLGEIFSISITSIFFLLYCEHNCFAISIQYTLIDHFLGYITICRRGKNHSSCRWQSSWGKNGFSVVLKLEWNDMTTMVHLVTWPYLSNDIVFLSTMKTHKIH